MQCDDRLRNQIIQNLSSFDVTENTAAKSAAVALIVVEGGFGANLPGFVDHESWQTTASLVLTTRSKNLRSHPGQWALPGGRVDPGETAITTAQREAHEEIDLRLTEQNVIGRLDDFVTRSGFVMSPVVFWGGKAEKMTPNPDEVDSIHRIPISELLRADAPMLDYDEIQDDDEKSNHPVLRMPIGDNWIAAPTAAILYQFREVCILGKPTRVAHFDQPRFAWR